VDLFTFVSWCLLTVIAVTAIGPLNIPIVGLAHKVQQGNQPPSFEESSFWWRSTIVSTGLWAMTIVMVFVLYLMYAAELGLPTGPVEIVFLMLYLAAAVWLVHWAFATDDWLAALGVFVLLVLLAGLPLLFLGWLTGFWRYLAANASWLLVSSRGG